MFTDPFGLAPEDCKKVKCPPLAVILKDKNVVQTAKKLSAATAKTGKEYFAYLYNNKDGSVGVGKVYEGSGEEVTPPEPAGTEIGEIHTHRDEGSGAHVIKNSPPSAPDGDRVRQYNHNSIVVGSSLVHAVPWQNPTIYFTVPLP